MGLPENIDALLVKYDLFDLEEGAKPTLSANEEQLVNSFRALDSDGRSLVLELVGYLASSTGSAN